MDKYCVWITRWVGYLTHYEGEGKPNYNNDDGRSFPYIHYIAQSIVKQEKDYKTYCEVALTIRGFIWWTPLLILLGSINLLSWYQVAISSTLLAVGWLILSLFERSKARMFFFVSVCKSW